MKLHYKQKLKYLNAVADHLIECGYRVDTPKHSDDFLDVWGIYKGKKCFIEVYVSIFKVANGIHGVWHCGDHEGTEMYLSNDPLYGLDTRWSIQGYLSSDGLRPFKKGVLK